MPRKTILKDEHTNNDHTKAKTNRFKATNNVMEELPVEAPSDLSGWAKKIYEKLAPALNDLSAVKAIDINTFKALCINCEWLHESYKAVQERGFTYIDDKGNIKNNPASSGIDKATKNVKALSNELGLTPSARASLIEISKPLEEKKSTDALAEGRASFI